MATGKFCPSSYKTSGKSPEFTKLYLLYLRDETLKVGLFTSFKALFPAVSKFFITWP